MTMPTEIYEQNSTQHFESKIDYMIWNIKKSSNANFEFNIFSFGQHLYFCHDNSINIFFYLNNLVDVWLIK